MEPVLSDADCLARSLSKPEAFESIFERHFEAIHRYLHRRVGRDLADELAADTFVAAFERRASCRAGDTALPWLYGIATNLLRRRFRSAISATTRSRLPSMCRSGRCARGCTGRAARHNASSPRKRPLSLSRHQELS
jgi:DNA-directed RNA polymerase specialized sigma24 family protein